MSVVVLRLALLRLPIAAAVYKVTNAAKLRDPPEPHSTTLAIYRPANV